jgi:hypothetical protein
MKDRIKNGANLLEDHVFQFDFLNDDFSKLPQKLQEIINSPEKRKKLVVYINPPYAEATTTRTVTGTGENKSGVAVNHKVNQYFKPKIGNAANEIFALFMAQVYDKIPNCYLAQFSTLKFVQGSNFTKFKEYFLAKYLKGFIMPANTFDNVKGKFPIGFTIWDTKFKTKIKKVKCDVFEKESTKLGEKNFSGNLPKSINKWLVNYYSKTSEFEIGTLSTRGNDFQNQNFIYIATKIENNVHDTKVKIFIKNITQICIYFSVRHCMTATWLNDRDQFLYPKKKWEKDKEFQSDCLAFALFHSQNKITSTVGTNHWIPFTETEINAHEKFDSNFMSKFISGKLKIEENADIYNGKTEKTTEKLEFSAEAKTVFDAGRELWKYYHTQPNCNVNASLYDIREHFQGRNENGKMNNKSTDETYTKLIADLRESLKILAQKIEPKVYEYEFLKK